MLFLHILFLSYLLSFCLTLFMMGLFGAAHGWGEAKRLPLPKICHTSYNDETWHTYTLLKEDPKNI